MKTQGFLRAQKVIFDLIWKHKFICGNKYIIQKCKEEEHWSMNIASQSEIERRKERKKERQRVRERVNERERKSDLEKVRKERKINC